MDKMPVYSVNHGTDSYTSLLRIKKNDGTMTDTVFASQQSDEVDDQAKEAAIKALSEAGAETLEVTVVLSATWGKLGDQK